MKSKSSDNSQISALLIERLMYKYPDSVYLLDDYSNITMGIPVDEHQAYITIDVHHDYAVVQGDVYVDEIAGVAHAIQIEVDEIYKCYV